MSYPLRVALALSLAAVLIAGLPVIDHIMVATGMIDQAYLAALANDPGLNMPVSPNIGGSTAKKCADSSIVASVLNPISKSVGDEATRAIQIVGFTGGGIMGATVPIMYALKKQPFEFATKGAVLGGGTGIGATAYDMWGKAYGCKTTMLNDLGTQFADLTVLAAQVAV